MASAVIYQYFAFRYVHEEYPTIIKQYGCSEFFVTGLVIDIALKCHFLIYDCMFYCLFVFGFSNPVNKRALVMGSGILAVPVPASTSFCIILL